MPLGLAAVEAYWCAASSKKVKLNPHAERESYVLNIWVNLVLHDRAFKQLLVLASLYPVKNKDGDECRVEGGVTAIKPPCHLHHEIGDTAEGADEVH